MITLSPKNGYCGAYCTGGGELTIWAFPGDWHTVLLALGYVQDCSASAVGAAAIDAAAATANNVGAR
jgi:hypothetical protein